MTTGEVEDEIYSRRRGAEVRPGAMSTCSEISMRLSGIRHTYPRKLSFFAERTRGRRHGAFAMELRAEASPNGCGVYCLYLGFGQRVVVAVGLSLGEGQRLVVRNLE